MLDPNFRDQHRRSDPRAVYERLGARTQALIDQARVELAATTDPDQRRRLLAVIDDLYVRAGLARAQDPEVKRLRRQLRATDDTAVETRRATA